MSSNTSNSENPEDQFAQYNSAAADKKLLVLPITATAIAGVICIVAAVVFGGGLALLAAVIGVVVVLAFFGLGQYTVFYILRNRPELAMTAALGVYLIQMIVLFIVMIILKNATFFDPKVFALVVVACALTWTVASVTAMLRTKVMYVEPGSGPGK